LLKFTFVAVAGPAPGLYSFSLPLNITKVRIHPLFNIKLVIREYPFKRF